MIDGSPASRKFLWLFGGSGVCLPDPATATQLCRRFRQYAHCVWRCPDACRLFQTSPAACWCCSLSNFVQKLCYKLPIDTFIQIFDQNLSPLLNSQSCSVCLIQRQNSRYFWCLVLWFEKRKVDKKSKPTWKLKHANSIIESFEYFCQTTSKSILIISSYSVSLHIQTVISSCAQTLYALRVLRAHGLQDSALHNIYRSVVLAKLLYASSS